MDLGLLEHGLQEVDVFEGSFGVRVGVSCEFLGEGFFLGDFLIVEPYFEDSFRAFVFSESFSWAIFGEGDAVALEEVLIDKEAP